MALDLFGHLDTFVGNVGMFDYFRSFRRLEPEQLADGVAAFMGVNVTSQLLGARCSLDALDNSGGSIIFTTSNAGTFPNGGGVLYTASKHALVGAVRQLAAELAPTIRVNAVAPGGTRTGLSGSALFGDDQRRLDEWEALEAAVEASSPLGFLAEPFDHTSAYVLLAAKNESRTMTGTIIASDGGYGIRGAPKRS